MKKETLIKLLILFNISEATIRRTKVFGVSYKEVEEYKYLVYAKQNGRMEI